ncbi:chromosome replication/partitioning protein [Borreliella burgdorferi]|uniref:chromosome replication/partitioning protein n=1 Tax=Borreliella burgdorferi TaxID=139 RepID=UPI00017F3659|nr:chromosome replication/partitioning protein [Borreliella burgdorferi]ACN55124.1 putative plasmid partition protein [Borreliella burgdorferi WI91-23]ATH10901.1 chromosome replication/partitioning protein [Borreliella burgdorferi]MCD2418490.1 chromosome replication/partitioning protein [Borreliella burgdorferi]MCD2420895.1 chromosome replication/partitioning protein [Borreliella burgdorferi]PRQ92131.1 chromosome partitioning protein [Borreliella burgdorferi]
MGKKYNNKKELFLNSRTFSYMNKELTDMDSVQDKDLINYNNLKEKLKYNLKDDIDNKIERMKILYEIKRKELYKYDNFSSFEHFVKHFVIAKSQAYLYLRVYEKVLEGAISIDKIKEIGFRGVQRQLKENLLNVKKENLPEVNNKKMSIKFLMKNKEFYTFCKEDTKRACFIFERLFFTKKEVLSDLINEYENYKRKQKRIKRNT